MKISELFEVKYGVNLELSNCEITDNKSEGINFVARTSTNNGVVAKVRRIEGIEPQAAGTLSCAAGGSVLSTFLQTEPYYSGRDLFVLTPKKEMSVAEKLYWCMVIKANAYRFNYGRQANKSLGDIEIPNEVPNWVINRKIVPITSSIDRKEKKITTDNWAYFRLGGKEGLFRFENCKCKNAGELGEGNDIDYIGAKKNDNGVIKRAAYDEKLVTKGNCIAFICDGQGSVGYTNYMDRDFIGSTTLSVGRNEHLNKYNALFLVTILDLERPKYSYGRKYRKHLFQTRIKLPATKEGGPDYEFMENYIKSLKYSDRI